MESRQYWMNRLPFYFVLGGVLFPLLIFFLLYGGLIEVSDDILLLAVSVLIGLAMVIFAIIVWISKRISPSVTLSRVSYVFVITILFLFQFFVTGSIFWGSGGHFDGISLFFLPSFRWLFILSIIVGLYLGYHMKSRLLFYSEVIIAVAQLLSLIVFLN